MTFFLRFLIFAAGLVGGLLILKYMDRIVRFTGASQWAEQKFGRGGSYTLWQLIGVGLIVVTFLIAFII